MGKKSKKDGGWLETFKTLFWALLIALVVRTLIVQPFWIPSGSMKDSLLIGDYLLVNKWAYGYSRYSCPFGLCPISGRILGSEPERGDVVVFRHPTNGSVYVKRLIGLPGDKVQMKRGILFINGEKAHQVPAGIFEEPYAPQGSYANIPRCSNTPKEGEPCLKSRARETLPGGKAHNVLNITPNSPGDDTDVLTVPAEHYFFIGDNRDNSLDSRYSPLIGGVGFVSAENLIGRADLIVLSSAGKYIVSFWSWRKDRFLKWIE